MDTTTSSTQKVDLYALVTNRIIELLEKGVIPWQKPWIEPGIPMNLLSKRPYRGINLWLLLSLNYAQNLFLTWDQLKKVGGSVKKGEKGHVVIFWKSAPKKDLSPESDKKEYVSLLRYYKVFNIEQCLDLPENIAPPIEETSEQPILACERIITNMPQAPKIKHAAAAAFYDKEKDYINMPKRKSFTSMETYYATLFHELVHSTGHEKRLKRKSITDMAEFGSDMYSLEELIAELGASYLSSTTGIHIPENSAAYIRGWLAKLKGDKRLIIHASGFSQKAVDYILNEVITETAKEEIEMPELITE